MRPELRDVQAASFPAGELAALADLRGVPGITVVLAEGRAWLRWPNGRASVLQRLLAVPGVELFVRSTEGWARWGSLLPAGELPLDQPGRPLAHVLLPGPIQPLPPGQTNARPVQLQLMRSEEVRETSGLHCRAAEVLAWSEQAPTKRLVALEAVARGGELLLMGPRLPEVPGQRFWGSRLLVPLGWRPEPHLPDHAWPEALDLGRDEIMILTAAGAEVLSRDAFQPLTRATLRLAAKG